MRMILNTKIQQYYHFSEEIDMGSGPAKEEPKEQKQQKIQLVVAQLQNKNFVRALEIMKEIIKTPSEIAYEKMGAIFQAIKIPDKAKQYYEKCLELVPTNAQILTKLAVIYGQQNKIQKSEELLKKALKEDPNKVQSLNYMAILKCKSGYFGEAINSIDFAIQKINENQHSLHGSAQMSDIVLANLYNNMGNTLKYQEKYGEAVQYFQKAIALNRQNSLFYVNCALALSHPEIQNYQKAYDYLEEAEKLLVGEKSEYNSYVLDKIVGFRKEIEEWEFKKRHNYVTPQEKEQLQIRLRTLEQGVNKLFCADLTQSSVLLHSSLSLSYDNKLNNIARVWRKTQMHMKSILEIDEDIFDLYQTNQTNFSIIPFHILTYSIKNKKQNIFIQQVQEQYILNTIKTLESKYPPSSSINTITTKIKSFEIPINERPNLFQNIFFKSYENLISQILKLPLKASNIFGEFQSFAKEVCLKRGSNFKAGLKFPANIDVETESKIIIRVTEKLFKKELSAMKNQIFEEVEQLLKSSQIINVSVLTSSFFKAWKSIITQILKDRITSKKQTPCHIYDLVRGKCMFKNASDIDDTFQDLASSCKKLGYQMIECDNRLQKGTRDINIKINIKGIICELQLALNFDSSQNGFAHGIYEILRSPGGCIFGSIIWLGKIKKISFIRDIQRLYGQIQYITTENMELYRRKLDYEYVLSEFKALQ